MESPTIETAFDFFMSSLKDFMSLYIFLVFKVARKKKVFIFYQ